VNKVISFNQPDVGQNPDEIEIDMDPDTGSDRNAKSRCQMYVEVGIVCICFGVIVTLMIPAIYGLCLLLPNCSAS